MPVIGTAGHVDHGKTSLIAALTGIDTDRLPEEKARGMTTDLGFAHFEGEGLRVGVIDVPGHERYIRNMVAGAAGIDGALLVVAADDGWMEQTGRHAEVLLALGIPVLALALTKAALVPPARVEAAAREALSRLGALAAEAPEAFREPPWLAVDSPTGRGIPELRALLLERLRLLPTGGAGGRPWLFVDRSFSLPGLGQIVAGSLRGGRLRVGDRLRLLPSGESLGLRSLQLYGQPATEAEPGSRVALSFQKSRAEILRGACLVAPDSEWELANSLYIALHGRFRDFKPRSGLSVGLAVGSEHLGARLFPSKRPGFLRAALERGLPARPGLPAILLRAGGAEILATGRIFALGGAEARERRRIEAALGALELPAPSFEASLAAFGLERQGCLRLGPASTAATVATVVTAAAGLPPGAERAGDWVFAKGAWAALRREALAAASEPGGFPEASLPGRLGLPPEAAAAALSRLAAEGQLVLKEGKLLPPSGASALPRSAQELGRRLAILGPTGLDLGAEPAPGLRRDLGLLAKAGQAVCLDDRLYLSPAAYRRFSDAILSGRTPGSRFGVGEAKEATGLSRKWILPLLNRMEGEGLLRRQGDERIVLGRSGA